MSALAEKVARSERIILEAAKRFPLKKTVIAWTGGKDSTVLLHIIRSVFGGKVPFPVMFNDSTMEFPEVIEFIDEMTGRWSLDLTIVPHSEKDLGLFNAERNPRRKKVLSRLMKINAVNGFIKRHRVKAIFSGIRWDEHPARSGETYFSRRPDHFRIHPILHFTEKDIWRYIRKSKVPYVSLYDKGYRSLGEKPFTKVAGKGGGERSGREKGKELVMEKLRNMGYW